MKTAQLFILILSLLLIYGCTSQEQKEANVSPSTDKNGDSMEQGSRGLDLVSEEPIQNVETTTEQSPAATEASQNTSENQVVTSSEGGQIVDVGGKISIR